MTSLVLHAFAPLDGPAAPRALQQLRSLWAACGDLLGMDAPDRASTLPVTPRDWHGDARGGRLAARERRDGGSRALLRRERDVLALSALLPGDPDGTGWVELDRWLTEAAGGGIDALIGTCRIYQELTVGPAAARSSSALPPIETAPDWWNDRVRAGSHAYLWEISPRHDTRRDRHLVMIGAAEHGPAVEALSWSDGETLPPLGRYLLHSAGLRHHYRVWTGDQRRIEALRAPAEADLTRLRAMHRDAIASSHALTETADAAGLRGDHGLDLVTDDQRFANWFSRLLDDATTSLDNLRRAAAQASPPPEFSGTTIPPAGRPRVHPPEQPGAAPVTDRQPSGTGVSGGHIRTRRHSLRMGFTVDAVGYSANDAKGREIVQQRIADVVGETLADMHLTLTDTDHQGTGDGVNVVLPADLDLPRTLAQLLHGTAAALRAERRRYADPLRLRMGASIGTFRVAALGWSDSTVIETNRLCDSDPVRAAMKDDPALLFAAMISDRLYPFTVDEGHPSLAPADFTSTEVTVKTFQARAWLWSPGSR